jgi:hypothetical protein
MNGVLGQRWLVVEVVGLADGYAGVRADAQVIWLKSRPASERVPGDARVLTVTRGYPKHKPSLSFTTTNATKIQELSALLNGLQIVQPGAVNCPAMLVAPTVTFTFRAARNGPPLTQASMPTTGPDGQCPGIALKVRGRARPPLYALPVFLRTAGRMLGVTLLTK